MIRFIRQLFCTDYHNNYNMLILPDEVMIKDGLNITYTPFYCPHCGKFKNNYIKAEKIKND